MRRISSRRRRSSGQALVEFTLVLPLLLMIFFSIIEFSLYFYTRVSLRHVVREAARYTVTGNVLIDSAGKALSKAQAVEYLIRTGTPGYQLGPSSIVLTPGDGGGPGDIVKVAVSYDYTAKLPPFKLLFPNGRLTIAISTVMKNELY